MKYLLGLEVGGLPEDREFHIDPATVTEIEADTLSEAKKRWARITKHDRSGSWNPMAQTYWGWQVVEVEHSYKRKGT